MGLFGLKKKKKPSPEELAQQAAAARAAEEAAKKRQAQARAAAQKAQQQERQAKEEDLMKRIQSYRKQIEQKEEAVRTFEIQKQKYQKMAIQAKNQGRMEEAKSHLRESKGMEKKITMFTRNVNMLRSQLQSTEELAEQKNQIATVQGFNEYMNSNKIDADEVGENIADMRDNMAAVEEVNQTMEADMNLNASIYDMDAEDELNALEAEFNKTAIDAAPQVPTDVPATPATRRPAASSAMSPEEEEIKRLEQGLAM